MGYPAQAVTDLDKSPVVQITTWLALITAFLATVSRVGSKLLLVRTVKLDDYFVVAALVRSFCLFSYERLWQINLLTIYLTKRVKIL